MSRTDPPARPPLPGADMPSAEVLDELLRAFSVDVSEQPAERVDLASPEVEELLAPPDDGPSPPRSDTESDPEPLPEVEVEAETIVLPVVDDEPQPLEDVETGTDTETAMESVEAVDTYVEPVEATAPKTIRIDAADDPPDAVYLTPGDPLLNRPAHQDVAAVAAPSDAPIFIDDRPTGETISIEDATSATRIEPRMRDRRIAVRRAAGIKRLRWVLVGLVVVLVVVGVLAVLGSSLFAIEDVEVEGAVYTDPVALAAVIDELEGSPVLRADTERAERDLEAIPWVDDARVTTDFPHGAKIEIRERAPAATFAGPDGLFRVIDGRGRVLDVLDSQPVDYLLVHGADAPALDAGQFAPQGYSAAASLVQALTPELRARAQSVEVTADGSDLRLMLTDGVEARFGAAQDLVVKLVRLQVRLDELDGGPMSYVDVSTNEVTTG